MKSNLTWAHISIKRIFPWYARLRSICSLFIDEAHQRSLEIASWNATLMLYHIYPTIFLDISTFLLSLQRYCRWWCSIVACGSLEEPIFPCLCFVYQALVFKIELVDEKKSFILLPWVTVCSEWNRSVVTSMKLGSCHATQEMQLK